MYKRFIYTSILIAISLYAMCGYIFMKHKMLYMNQEYPMWVHIKETITTENEDKCDFIIIGDSRAKAGFIPQKNNKFNSLNLSVGGGTPIEGFYILKKFLQTNIKPKEIVLSYAPYHLAGQDTYWDRTIKFDFLTEEECSDVENNSQIIQDSNTLGANKTCKDYLSPVKYTADFTSGILKQRWNTNNKVLNDCRVSKGHYYFGREEVSSGLNIEASKNIFKESKLINHYFHKLLKLAKENNIKISYFTMPFNESSFAETSIEYKNKYNKYIDSLSSMYNINICNQLSFMSNDNFGDNSHLYRGAKKNTQLIYDCIR